MDTNTNKSEVAMLLRQISMEYEAAQRGLSGLAETARHQFITVRMENISHLRGKLAQQVGDQEAMRLLSQEAERSNEAAEKKEAAYEN